MVESASTDTFGPVRDANVTIYVLGMGAAICLLLGQILAELQKQNKLFGQVFLTSPLSLQGYKDLEGLIAGSSQGEAGRESRSSPKDS